jgi:hypothetical protein
LPEKSIDILETIKLFLDAEGCVFIIGANKQIIDNIIKYRYKDIELEGSEYLDKIIQVSFNVPRLGRGDAINFIEKIAPVPIIEYKEIISHAGGNPRKIKRTINKFILQMIISETYEFLKQNIDKAVLAKLVVLELAWNDFYNDVIRNHNEISGRSLTLQNLKILLDSSVKDEKLQEFKYLKDPNLISFLDKYPKLWEINLSPYIYLSKKLDIDTSSSKDGIPSSFPHCGKKRLTKWSRNIDGNSRNDFEEGFQCYACGAVYYFNENHKDGFIWRETAPRCSDCNAIMLWVSYGGSEGAYGNYEDDFVFKCPKCSKIG